ncbi:beta-lactamase-like protein [Chaetomium strumarium]|uniref:Beta-lactamase-like protein n=1 Tax=Chaetomium strumarium TaxID=1170767 RepID=A0AAJ0LZ44_9PEZI|nr:beta-lactamase-like protein [Chaetomium strumarium]
MLCWIVGPRNAGNGFKHAATSPASCWFTTGSPLNIAKCSEVKMRRLPLQSCLGATELPTTPARVSSLELQTLSRAGQNRAPHQQLYSRNPVSRVNPRRTALPTMLPTLNPVRTPVRRTYTTASTAGPATASPEPVIHPLFEPQTSTWQYVVADPTTQTAAIIDPVLDYDKCTCTVTTRAADALLSLVRSQGFTISHILETHAHADHLTAAFYLQKRLAAAQDGKRPVVGIGKRIGRVQSLFGQRYEVASEEYDGVFDVLFEDDEVFEIGRMEATAMHLPGHTPDHMGYRIGDNVFCGDSLFHPTLGTARCDFPGGSAQALYRSARKLLALPGHVRIWTGHDYPGEGEREAESWTSVAEHRARNKLVRDGVSEQEFVERRNERDSQLSAPRLLHESLQVNIRAGQLPRSDNAGMRAFKLPIVVQAEGL